MITKLVRRLVRPLKEWRQRISVEFGVADLRPAHDLQRVSGAVRGYQSLGADPQFRLKYRLAAGWYMAEVDLAASSGHASARFYLDTGSGESEAQAFALPVKRGRLAKRLLYVPRSALLRFDPQAEPGHFTLNHFRLVRMLASAAHRRLFRKLEAANTRYKVADARKRYSLEQALIDYNSLFEVHDTDDLGYERWIGKVEASKIPTVIEQQRQMDAWPSRPVISVVVPVWNTSREHLTACLDSVLAQTYPHWQLCIADDASTQTHVAGILRDYAARDPRVHLNFRARNGHISAASNSALALAEGDFVAMLDHDDVLAPHALYMVAEAIQRHPDAQILYSDEDKLEETGTRCDPFFKPDWSEDLLLSQNYICHLAVYRRSLVTGVGGFRVGYEGSQDYDLLLRCVAQIDDTRHIVHVPHVLYHWRKAEGSTSTGHANKDYASAAAVRALNDYVAQKGYAATVSTVQPGIYRSRWTLPEPAPFASLIIPTRDQCELLKTCIESIRDKTDYPRYEIIVVDNQSSDSETLRYLQALSQAHGEGPVVRVLRFDQPFNYSQINNFAVQHAEGQVLGFVNNDIEVISPGWLTEMISHANRPQIGCVGAKLYYPDNTLQHAGVVLGVGGVAGHSHKYFPQSSHGYFGRLRTIHNVSAVTGATLLVRREVFDQVGGFDEGLQVAFNDVDLCLRIRAAGYRNLWTPYAELYHHESKSRGSDDSPEKAARFNQERDFMIHRWGHALQADPFYNPNLTLAHENYGLRFA